MPKMSQIERTIQLENDIILPVFGQFDSNIRKIEKSCGVQIVNRGDDVKVVGEERGVHKAWSVLNSMAALARRGEEITEQNLEYFISSAEEADLQELEKVYDNLICISQSLNRFNLNDINGLRGSYYSAVSFCFVDNIVAFIHFKVCIFLGHVSADGFLGFIESIIIRVNRHLGQDGADRLGDTTAKKL